VDHRAGWSLADASRAGQIRPHRRVITRTAVRTVKSTTIRPRRLRFGLPVLAACLALWTASGPRAQSAAVTFMPVDDLKPGMVGVGRTVFAGDALEDFKVHIIGVLKNIMGPRRDLILARLEGGPLANTGVIAGMSGSPVYIDGKLIGAVSYALGSFPKEPLAGITPIAEMMSAVDATAGRPASSSNGLGLTFPASPSEVLSALGRLAERAAAPVGGAFGSLQVVGPSSLASVAPSLRPIGAAMFLNGFDPALDRGLRDAFAMTSAPGQSPAPSARADASPALRPGDPVGVSLVRGDFEMGATGTITHIDGNRIYAFGHPFLNLGSTGFAMTRARVYTVLPSLDSSMKIATMGSVIGTMSQDRATAIGGQLGQTPRELEINLTLQSDRAAPQTFKFFVLQDPSLTALFTYVCVLNSLTAYERQTGVLSITSSGSVSFGSNGTVTIDDVASGETALSAAASAIASPIGVAIANDFRPAMPDTLSLTLRASERQQSATIDRVWLDTTRPHYGESYTLQVQVRDFRGAVRTVPIPVTMPAQADGPLTLMVGDAPALTSLNQRDVKPGKPTNWNALLTELNAQPRNNRIYVRLLSSGPGVVVGGETLPGLPASVRSVLDADATVSRAAVAKTVVGAWEQRLDVAVRGSRELTVTLTPRH
jgi:hypothetical protein